jgi:hypothetical protein
MSSTYQILKSALLNRKPVIFTYGKHERHVCPHVLGWSDGEEQCLAYQFDGGSSQTLKRDGDPENFRCLEVAKMSGARIVENGQWHTSDDRLNAEQTCVDRIDVSQPSGRFSI